MNPDPLFGGMEVVLIPHMTKDIWVKRTWKQILFNPFHWYDRMTVPSDLILRNKDRLFMHPAVFEDIKRLAKHENQD